MNKYNERVLKNVLEDIREENDIKLQQEAEEAATNPLFANNDNTDQKLQDVLNGITKVKKRKQRKKSLLRVASVFFALLIGLTVMTLSVKGFREKLWNFLSNIGNSSYSLFVASNNPGENMLSEYEGMYIPTYIPEGYEIISVDNNSYYNTIKYKNESDKTISFTEYPKSLENKINLDKESFDSFETYQNGGRETILLTKNDIIQLYIKENCIIIQVTFNDKNIDVKSFAEMIEKK